VIYIGVDPGKSGALAAIDESSVVLDWIKCDSTDHDIAEWLRQWPPTSARAVLEKVGATPQMGVTSAFTFGDSRGFLRGQLVAHRIAFEMVSPVKWQNAMECRTGGDKNISKAAAQRLWPAMKITHANADALLLAEWLRRQAIRTALPCIQGGA
jgi:hypothetical protein